MQDTQAAMTQIVFEDMQHQSIGIVVDIYARVSTDIQEEDGTSLETQVENCLALATEKGYIVGKIFREVFTGALYRERPLLSEARMRYRNEDSQGLLFNTFDRLSRNQTHLGVFIDEMQHYNVFIECVKEKFDTSAAGQFMRNALAFVAEVEREKILARTDDGRRKRARDGKMLGWHSPRYGYAWNEERTAYVINEEEAKIVKRIYAMVLQGISIHSIASILTAEKVPTRGNPCMKNNRGVWLHSTVHRILSSECYIGVAVVYRTRQEKINGHRHTTFRSDEDVITLPDGVIPPLVDKATFDKVQEQLQKNKERSARNNQQPEDTLLRCGLVVCGYCGRNGVVTRKGNGKIDYRCKSSGDPERGVCEGFIVLARSVDAAAWAGAIKIITNPAQFEEKMQVHKQQNQTEGEHAPINRRLKDIEKEVQNLMTMGQYSQDADSLKTLGRLLIGLEKEKAGLLLEQKKLQNIDILYKEKQEKIAAFEKRCSLYREKLEGTTTEFSYQEKREALEYFGIKALVWRANHRPHYQIVSDGTCLCVYVNIITKEAPNYGTKR